MKVLLIRPDRADVHLDKRGHEDRLGDMHQPIGLLYLGAMLEAEGIETAVCDEIVDQDAFEAMARYQPDLVGISLTSMMMPRAVEITERAKQAGHTVVLGGPHPSAMPAESLLETGADIAVIGEGEYTIVELCQGKELAEVQGIAHRDGDQVKLTAPRPPIADLDALPLPARHLLELRRYRHDVEMGFPLLPGELMLRILTARGCPFPCTNCCSHTVFGREHRARSPELVVDEMQAAMGQYGVRTFTFIDDNLPLNEATLSRICHLILERGLDVRWSCYARVGTSKETLRLMKAAGCALIAYGVESGSPRVLASLNKRITPEQVTRTFDATREVGIRTKAFFIIGLPEETEQDFQMSMALARRINPDLLWASIFYPLPGSALYDGMSPAERERLDFRKASFFRTDDPVLAARHKRFLTDYYFSPRFVRNMLGMLSYADILHYLRIARVYLRTVARR